MRDGLRWLAFQNAGERSVLTGNHGSMLTVLATPFGLTLVGGLVGFLLRSASVLCTVVACVATAQAVWKLDRADVSTDLPRGWNLKRILGLTGVQVLAFVLLPLLLVMVLYGLMPSLKGGMFAFVTYAVALALEGLLAPLWLWMLSDQSLGAPEKLASRVVAVAASLVVFAIVRAQYTIGWSFPGDVSSHLWTSMARTIVNDLPQVPEFVAFALLVVPRRVRVKELEMLQMGELPAAGPVS
ncbi:hypothetical protein [Bryocella elongata]|nr:hypothetical protein [Bryocella elongata]